MFWINLISAVLVVVVLTATFGVYAANSFREPPEPEPDTPQEAPAPDDDAEKLRDSGWYGAADKPAPNPDGLRAWGKSGYDYELHFDDGVILVRSHFFPSGEFCYAGKYGGAKDRLKKQLEWGMHKELEIKGSVEKDARAATLALKKGKLDG